MRWMPARRPERPHPSLGYLKALVSPPPLPDLPINEALPALAEALASRRNVLLEAPPGAGKSTLAGALVTEIRRRGKTVAIVAVDPSSKTTGGAILGDRIRMQSHAGDAGIVAQDLFDRVIPNDADFT